MINLQAMFYIRRFDWPKFEYYAREQVQSYDAAKWMVQSLAKREQCNAYVIVENWSDLKCPSVRYEHDTF